MSKTKTSILILLLITAIITILFFRQQAAQMDLVKDTLKKDVASQNKKIQVVETTVAELFVVVKSINAATNPKSKRWVNIMKVRNIAKNTITKVGYPIKMNIVTLTRYASAVVDASNEYDVPIPLILAVTRQESAFNPKAVSHAGAQGLMQLMPGTAKECAGDIGRGYTNVFHVGTNVQLGTFYLRKMLTRFNDDIELAVKAYNAGPNYVSKVLAKQYRTYPAETINYSKKVLQYLEEYRASYN